MFIQAVLEGRLALAASTTLLILVSAILYRLFFHPLAHIPGPFFAKITSLWLSSKTYAGVEASTLQRLHRKYGPVMRIAPNEIDISDGAALQTIYAEKGGFLKAPYYANFDIDGHSTVFSALDPKHRSLRAKAVLPLFSTASIRSGSDKITDCVDRMIDRLESEKKAGGAVNILNITRSLALDAVSAYLFDRPYNGIQEQKLSASHFVDAFVAVGRFFYLPSWAFVLAETLSSRMDPNAKHVDESMSTVDNFVTSLVESAEAGDNTYQGRLKGAGLSDHENKAQCKDLMFAGTDSTGMNLATIMYNLAKHPETYAKLREEVSNTGPGTDPQTLPYVRAVINEGLRLSMANPTRFPRVVPSSGYDSPTSPSYHLPAGSIVGVTPYILYYNSEVYSESEKFDPDRWLSATQEMSRDHIPFGLGTRQCIARNLAIAELFYAVDKLARSGVLSDARPVSERIEIVEWFNSKVKGEKIELTWDR